MAFMVPEYLERRAWHIDGPCGIVHFFAEVTGRTGGEEDSEWLEFEAPDMFAEMFGEEPGYYWSVERDESPQWYCRLNAPGYMDATEWSGPYETEAEARAAIVADHGVDADSGESLGDEA